MRATLCGESYCLPSACRDAPLGQRQGGVFRLPPPYLWITRTTADAFNQIIADMESFAEIAQNTMEKANSQAESLEQIGQGIEQLSSVVQGNAASSEENTAISVNLAEGAGKMHDRVNIFKLF